MYDCCAAGRRLVLLVYCYVIQFTKKGSKRGLLFNTPTSQPSTLPAQSHDGKEQR